MSRLPLSQALIVTLTSAILQSCSVVSVNLSQDARVLDPGKVLVRAGMGLGLDLADEALLADTDDADFPYGLLFPPLGFLIRSCLVVGARVGIASHADLSQSLWLPIRLQGLALGGRTSMTVSLTPKASKWQFAMLPAALYYYSAGDSASIDNLHIYGGELTAMVSYDITDRITPFAALAYGRNYVVFRDAGFLDLPGRSVVQRYSLQLGVVQRFGKVSLMPEIGLHELSAGKDRLRLGISFGVAMGSGF